MAFTQKFYIADTHFGHQGMLEFGGRPFTSTEEMDRTIIDNWNQTVRPTDLVFHLGDFGFGDTKRLASIFGQLNGRKRLVTGNHDIDHKGNVKKDIAALGWDEPPTAYAETSDEGHRVILFHYAMRTWSASVHGSWHFYGHSHGRMPAFGRSRDVGVDCSDVAFTPRTFRQLTAGMQDAEVAA